MVVKLLHKGELRRCDDLLKKKEIYETAKNNRCWLKKEMCVWTIGEKWSVDARASSP